MNTTELYTQWLEKATADPDLQAELQPSPDRMRKFATGSTAHWSSAPPGCEA